MIIALVMLLASCILPIRPFDEEKWREQVESADPSLLYAPHLRDGRYFNPWMPMQKGFIDFLRWQLSEKTLYSPGRKTTFPRSCRASMSGYGQHRTILSPGSVMPHS
ncbi:MAG: hypothetical protein MZV70_24970 [Desulfobacterales bacterium]|nr:hypothetical protein [Desulfobacterales bacterium]